MATLPESFSYGLKAAPPVVRSTTVAYTAQNQSYTGGTGSTIRIDLGEVRNAWIDTHQSYVTFTLRTDTRASELDFTAGCLFNRIEVYAASQSAQLETIQGANLLYNALFDCTASQADMMFSFSTTAGSSDALPRRGLAVTQDINYRFAIPLPGILGLGCDKMMPALGYTILITLEDPAIALIAAGALGYVVSDVAYVASLHEVSPQVNEMIMAANGPQMMIPAVTWRGFSSTIEENVRAASINIGVRVSSMKSLLFFTRQADQSIAQAMHSLSNRLKSFLATYQIRIGSTQYPQRPVTNTAEASTELQKSFHNLSISQPGLINYTSYNRDVLGGVADPLLKGSFIAGLDLEPHIRNKSDTLMGGISTLNNTQVNADLTYSADHAALVFNTFVHHDVLLAVMGNAMTAQF